MAAGRVGNGFYGAAGVVSALVAGGAGAAAAGSALGWDFLANAWLALPAEAQATLAVGGGLAALIAGAGAAWSGCGRAWAPTGRPNHPGIMMRPVDFASSAPAVSREGDGRSVRNPLDTGKPLLKRADGRRQVTDTAALAVGASIKSGVRDGAAPPSAHDEEAARSPAE